MDHITIDMPEQDTPKTSEWMMMCLPGRWDLTDLHQIEFTHRPTTNAEFFARLKLEYDKKRPQPFPGWKFWLPRGRKFTGIHFVKFSLIGLWSPWDVDVKDNPGLPDIDEEGWVLKQCSGDQSRAPLNADTMRWMLLGDVLEGWDIYDLTPRKLQSAMPAERGSVGWGLYFAEEEYWKVWYPAVAIGGTLVIAFGARVVAALIAEKAFGLIASNDFLVFPELTMAIIGIAFFYEHLRNNKCVYWDLTEFR
jgi:hypothetical protein